MDVIVTDLYRAIIGKGTSEPAAHADAVSIVPPEHPAADQLPATDSAPPHVAASPSPNATSERAQGAAPQASQKETKQAAVRNTAAPLGPGPEAELLSRETRAAVDSAFETLAQTVRKQNSQTLEDFVRETIQPRLTSWLDQNLPGLVERMVRMEIERVARRH